MSLWDILLPGGGSRREDYGNGKVGYVSPDAWRIREGDEVYHFDGVKGNGKPASWKVTKLYSPSEARREWPECLPTWPSPDYRAPYKYPVLELDGRRTVWSAAEAVLEDTINKIYGR